MVKNYSFSRFAAFVLLLLLSGSGIGYAQLSGTIAVPSTQYPTLDSVINSLNRVGVGAGGVVINVNADQTAPAPDGYMLGSVLLNASVSSSKTITINGNGKTITAFTGISTFRDGIFKIRGTDYVTIDGLNLTEKASNTTTTTQMEWGYALVKLMASAPFDGCQFVTIKNCNITLNSSSTATVGIYLGNHLATVATLLTITSPNDAHSNNTFQNNTINNVFRGISAMGYGAPSPYTLYDINNQFVGNTIQNFGGSSTGYGMYFDNQTGIVVRGNTIANEAGGGSPSSSTIYGIYQIGTGTNAKIVSNKLNMANASSSTMYLIYSNASGDSLAIDSNKLNFTSTSSGSIYGAYPTSSVKHLRMNANIYDSIAIDGAGTFYGFYIASASKANGSITVNDNKIKNVTRSTGGICYLFYQTGSVIGSASYSVRRNKIDSVTANSTLYGYYLYGGAASAPVKYIEYDTFTNVTTTGTMYGLYTYNVSPNSQVAYNYFNNVVGGSSMYLLYTLNSNSTGLKVHHNTLQGISNTSSSSTSYLGYIGGNNLEFYNNLITNVESGATSSAVMYPIYVNGGDTISFYNNMVSDVRAPTASSVSPIYGMYVGSGTNTRIYNNTIKIDSVSTTGSDFGATGIYYTSSNDNIDIQNNIISVKVTPVGNGYTVALRRNTGTTGVPPSNLSLTTNRNIYHVPNATNAYLYAEGTSATSLVNAYNLSNDPAFNTPCGLYKTFMSPRENGAFTEDKLTAAGSITGVFAPTGTSYAKSNANPISNPAITTDFYGVTRPAFPDAGALQFTGTSLDAAGPSIVYTSLPKVIYCNAVPTLTAIITDPAGVNNTTGTKPRLYYKKSTEANAFNPAQNNSGFNGWKWVEGTNVGSTYSFTPNYSLLTSSFVTGDSLQYFVVAQDNATTPNVTTIAASYPTGYCPTSVSLPSTAGPLTSTVTVNGYKLFPTAGFAATISPKSVCISNTIKLNLNRFPGGLTLQWQSKPLVGGSYTNLPGVTNPSDTIANITSSTLFRARFYCGSTLVDSSAPDTVIVTSPQILSARDTGRCGPGTLTLNATASTGSTVNWYSAATGGAPVATGSTYTTPSLTNSATYYVSASTGGSGASETIVTGTNPNTTGVGTGGMMFDIDAVTGFTIDSVYAAFASAGMQAFDVYIKSGTHCGFQSNAGVWTLVSSGMVNGTTAGSTFALATPVSIPAGVTGVYFMHNAKYLSTPSSCSSVVVTNADMTIRLGSAIGSLFGSANNRAFAGSLIYHKGCETPRRPVKAYIGTAVTASATASATTICKNDSAVLKAAPRMAGYSYQWYLGGNPITGATDSTYAAKLAGTYTVEVKSVPVGCSNTSTTGPTITVNTVPTTVTPNGTLIVCTGNVDTLSAPTGAGFTYQWYNNGLVIPGATARQLQVANSGNYKVKITDPAIGCSDTSLTVVVSVMGAPPANINPLPRRGICPGKSITLSTPTISGLTYQWRRNGSDITGATGQTYTATQPGTYTLRVNAGRGCQAISDSVVLFQEQAPSIAVNPPAPSNICGTGGSITLSAITGNYSYQWISGTAPIAGATNYNYTVTTAGSYRVAVTSNYTGCTDTSVSRNIQVVPLPATPTLSPSGNATICSADSLTIRAVSSGAVKWQWYRDGAALNGDTAVTYTARNQSGAYTVRIKDANGCQSASSAPLNLTVNPTPTALITYATPLDFCNGSAVVLTANTEAGNHIQWLTNGTAIPNDTLPYKTVSVAGNYSIRVTSGGSTCTRTSVVIPVTVYPAPQPVLSRSGFVLSVANGPFATYQWYRNNLPIAGATGATHTATANGVYAVKVTDAKGCEGMSNTTVVGTVSVTNTAVGTLRIFPNPTQAMVQIEAPVVVDVVVRDVSGRLILNEKAVRQIDLSGFADGLYMLYVLDAEGALLTTEKITKSSGR